MRKWSLELKKKAGVEGQDAEKRRMVSESMVEYTSVNHRLGISDIRKCGR